MPAGQQIDALAAFTYLSDNIPAWLGRLSELSTHTTAKNAEYAEAYKRHVAVRPRRRKNSSICSIRTEDLRSSAPDTETRPQSSAAETRTTVTTPNTSQHQANVNPRKRGAEEAPTLDGSDQGPFVSTRNNLIIHYDGHTQKVLEEMVRNIGTARNNIRKGRMASLPVSGYRNKMLDRSARLNSLAGSLTSSESSEDDVLSSIRKARNQGPPGPRAREHSPFDAAEKQLELVHEVCETAAYHFLRSGDCSADLASVEGKFKGLLDLATNEVRRLKAEQPEVPVVQEETPTMTPTGTTIEADRQSLSKIDIIEVDDGTESVESIDLTAFRANRRRR
ncbi:hypothetical protein BO94DRAFT_458480 [Aspergillus sclerotioniger CBS 115572]|uniref:Uncharacterized protein n=1 Tax=Aspergillus sclerotioniger CBS 115572 TaxID=1450535 RepID=A0A317X8C5_9EURO|nr:hypothetical protein BO94DRAFT_458480 [Aspergillus sclerotioniger CBS 115572]PWY93912.1 hypothetical protein BO94DRAFT_458480 [Aspergillus sclerotioniger CBS 115572]